MYRDTKTPWIKWDPPVFLSEIRGMNAVEVGIFTYLGQYYWLRECKPLKQDYMVYLMGTIASNEKRLDKFKKKFPIFFNNEGEFFSKALDDALSYAIDKKLASKKGNDGKKLKKQNREAEKLNNDAILNDRPVSYRDKDTNIDTDINKDTNINRDTDNRMIGSSIAKITNNAFNKSKGLKDSYNSKAKQ